VMALSLGQISSTLHERKRLGEVLEPKRAHLEMSLPSRTQEDDLVDRSEVQAQQCAR
jgi:hypothetical protein